MGKKVGGRSGELDGDVHVAEQAILLLVVARDREMGEPGIDEAGLVSRRNLVELAVGKDDALEELRRHEVGETHLFGLAVEILHFQGLLVVEGDQAIAVDRGAVEIRGWDLGRGSHEGSIEGFGEGLEVEAEIGVDGVHLLERPVREQRPRILEHAAILAAARVVIERFLAPGDVEGVPGRRHSHPEVAAQSVLVRAVVAVGVRDESVLVGERGLRGQDVHGAGERVGSIQDRARAAHHFDALNAGGIDQAHFDARAVGGGARVVQSLAVDQNKDAGRVQAAEPRTHLEGAAAHRGNSGRFDHQFSRRGGVGGGHGRFSQALGPKRDHQRVSCAARRGNRDLALKVAHGQDEVHLGGRRIRGEGDVPRRLGEPGDMRDHAVDPRGQAGESVGAGGVRDHRGPIAGRRILERDFRSRERAAVRVAGLALYLARRRGARDGDGEKHQYNSAAVRESKLHRFSPGWAPTRDHRVRPQLIGPDPRALNRRCQPGLPSTDIRDDAPARRGRMEIWRAEGSDHLPRLTPAVPGE